MQTGQPLEHKKPATIKSPKLRGQNSTCDLHVNVNFRSITDLRQDQLFATLQCIIMTQLPTCINKIGIIVANSQTRLRAFALISTHLACWLKAV